MMVTIPELPRKTMADIKKNAEEGTYRVDVGSIKIDVFPYVFPPDSQFSRSSFYSEITDLDGLRVLDVGTGTGILAIAAAKAGASMVDAVDLETVAVECARHNVELNGVDHLINVCQSDLFSRVPEGVTYDLILANLPIVDYPEEDVRFHSLFDPGFKYHERFFADARGYLSGAGMVMMCHADLSEGSGFGRLECLAGDYGFDYTIAQTTFDLGHEWRIYEFRVIG